MNTDSITQFSDMTACFEKISKSNNISQKEDILTNFIKKFRVNNSSCYPLMRLLLPSMDTNRKAYAVKENNLSKFYLNILAIEPIHPDYIVIMNYKSRNSCNKNYLDFAENMYNVLKNRCLNRDSLTIEEINDILNKLSEASGRLKNEIIEENLRFLFQKTTALDQKWLIRIILKDLSIGLSNKAIFKCFHPLSEECYNETTDLNFVCEKFKFLTDNIESFDVRLFKPFKPMLSKRGDIKNVIIQMNNQPFIIEIKYDGERVQLHKFGSNYRYWSRSGLEWTSSYGMDPCTGTLTQFIHKQFKSTVDNCILDGEMMGFNIESDTMGCKTDKFDIKNPNVEKTGYMPCFIVFDVLYLNNKVLTHEKLLNRKHILDTQILDSQLNGKIMISKWSEASTREECLESFNNAIENCEEGIMVKKIDSNYKTNSRSAGWFKMKPDYILGLHEELDCVIVGGYFSGGKLIRQFLCAVKSNESEYRYYSFVRLCSGFSRKMIFDYNAKMSQFWKRCKKENIPDWLKLSEKAREIPDVIIEPENSFVVQLKAAEIISSESYATKCTLRFCRIDCFREDKSPLTDCMTVKHLHELKDSHKGKLALHPLEIHSEDEDQTIKKTAKRMIKHIDVPDNFKSTVPFKKPNIISEANSIFSGKEICIMLASTPIKDCTKPQLESFVFENGGVVVQNPAKSTFAVIANKSTIKIQNLIKSNMYDILSSDWMLECIKKKAFIAIKPTDFIFMKTKTAKLYENLYDAAGDSYTDEMPVESLKRFFQEMDSKSLQIPNLSSIEKSRFVDEMAMGDLDSTYLNGCVIHFPMKLQYNYTQVQLSEMERLQCFLNLAGAIISEDVEQTSISHLILMEISNSSDHQNENESLDKVANNSGENDKISENNSDEKKDISNYGKVPPSSRIKRRSVLQRSKTGKSKLNFLLENCIEVSKDSTGNEINILDQLNTSERYLNTKNTNPLRSFDKNLITYKNNRVLSKSNSDSHNKLKCDGISSQIINKDKPECKLNEENELPRLKKPDKVKLEYFSLKTKPMIVDFSEEFLQSLTNTNSILPPNENSINNDKFPENNANSLKSLKNIFENHTLRNLTKSQIVEQSGSRSKSLIIPKYSQKTQYNLIKQPSVSVSPILKIQNKFQNKEDSNCKADLPQSSIQRYNFKILENRKIFDKNSNSGTLTKSNYPNQSDLNTKHVERELEHLDEPMKRLANINSPMHITSDNSDTLNTFTSLNNYDDISKSNGNEDSDHIESVTKITLPKHFEYAIDDMLFDAESIIEYNQAYQAFLVKFPLEELNSSFYTEINFEYPLIHTRCVEILEENTSKNLNLSFEQEYNKEIEKHRKPPIAPPKESEKERKRIYVTVLEDIFQFFLDKFVDFIVAMRVKNENLPVTFNEKCKHKINVMSKKQMKLIEITIEQEIIVQLIDHQMREIFKNSEYKRNNSNPKCLSSKWLDDIANLKSTSYSFNIPDNNEENKTCLSNSFNLNESKLNYAESKSNSMHQRLHSSEKNKFKILDQINPEPTKPETAMLISFKQAMLKYEVKFRKLSEEKEILLKENTDLLEQNRNLQKRHGVLLNEYKQEKREIIFIKTQIDVMISRLQSIPEKLNQLEDENENLKSEVSDLERTLVQRDQLFNSERQINTNLSEEIIKLEADTVDKELMKNVCEEFENLNDEYESLKISLEETEDKLYEVVQDRDNLIKHAKIMEEHLYKLRSENNYYQVMMSSGVLPDNYMQRFPDNRENIDSMQNKQNVPQAIEKHEYETRPKMHNEQHSCRHYIRKGNRGHSHRSNRSYSSSSTSSGYSISSSGSEKRHRKKRKKSHKHKHKESHSHKHSSHKKKDKKHSYHKNEEIAKSDPINMNQNSNPSVSSGNVIEMPKNREELKELEKLYDSLQIKKNKLEGELSHVPINKGTSNTSNLTNMREQELLEEDLDQCDKKLATLRKILRQCKVFKMVP